MAAADVLAGRKTVGEMQGDILFSGVKPTQTFLRRFTGCALHRRLELLTQAIRPSHGNNCIISAYTSHHAREDDQVHWRDCCGNARRYVEQFDSLLDSLTVRCPVPTGNNSAPQF